jgi:hypothetical protein
MQFWIERPLSAAQIQAFDQLDSLLTDSKYVLRFTLQRDEM